MKDENTLGIGMCYFDCIIIKFLTVSLEILRKTIKFPNIATVYKPQPLAHLTSLLMGQQEQNSS